MKTEEKLDIVRGMSEEIVTESELADLFDKNKKPLAYDGFEPSGFAHIGSGILRAINLQELQRTGVRFKLLLADWHAWINNKLGGDMESIQVAGDYMAEVWKAAGLKDVEVVWAGDLVKEDDYWVKVVKVAKATTLNRSQRAISIMGRKAGEMKDTAQLFYPMMQVADAFHLDVDIAQLGMDQRRAGMLAREIADKMKWKKPVMVSHHMLMGLEGIKKPDVFELRANLNEGKPYSFDESKEINNEISSKMSKSRPGTAIFVHDSREEIERKLSKAFCPVGKTEGNPVLEYNRYVVFKRTKDVKVERGKKFGGDVKYKSYGEMESDFVSGELHPSDLKASTAKSLDEIIKPVRSHFEKNPKAKELYAKLKKARLTR